jgi:hypothetical protein
MVLNSTFACWSVLTDFCHIFHLLHMLPLFEFFCEKELLKVIATVAHV